MATSETRRRQNRDAQRRYRERQKAEGAANGATRSKRGGQIDLTKLSGDDLTDELKRAQIETAWLKNETEAATLMQAADARALWTAKLNALKSAVDAMPARLKMRVADASPEVIAAVRECLDEIVEAVK